MARSYRHGPRSRETQEGTAAWFRGHGWPWAQSTGAGSPGVDVTNMPGLSPEVKATAGPADIGALNQAHKNRGTGVPFVVWRPNGYGPERIEQWPVIMRLDDFTSLLRAAGYGDPEEKEETA